MNYLDLLSKAWPETSGKRHVMQLAASVVLIFSVVDRGISRAEDFVNEVTKPSLDKIETATKENRDSIAELGVEVTKAQSDLASIKNFQREQSEGLLEVKKTNEAILRLLESRQ